MNNQHDPDFQHWTVAEQLQLLNFFPLPSYYRNYSSLVFSCVLGHVMRQISRIALFSIPMHRILWLTPWKAEPTWKGRLTRIPFQGRCLFGEALHKFIKEIWWRKNPSLEKCNTTLLQVLLALPTAEYFLTLSRLQRQSPSSALIKTTKPFPKSSSKWRGTLTSKSWGDVD